MGSLLRLKDCGVLSFFLSVSLSLFSPSLLLSQCRGLHVAGFQESHLSSPMRNCLDKAGGGNKGGGKPGAWDAAGRTAAEASADGLAGFFLGGGGRYS